MWNDIADSPAFWLGLIVGLTALWLLPVIIGLARHAQPISVILILTLFPLLWPAALIGAFMLPRKDDARAPTLQRAYRPQPGWYQPEQAWSVNPRYRG